MVRQSSGASVESDGSVPASRASTSWRCLRIPVRALLSACAALLIFGMWRTTSASTGPNSFPREGVFDDVSEEFGLIFQHVNGMTGEFYIAEMMGSGAALFDYDGDGKLDIFLIQSGPFQTAEAESKRDSRPNHRLLRNDLQVAADGSRRLRFTDVTEASGIRARGYGMGVAVGDFNNDGFPDLYVTNLGANQLFRNNGDGTFTDVTAESGVGDPLWSTSATFVDFDGDGWLDLYVTNYVDFSLENNPLCFAPSSARDYCGPQAFQPQHDRLYRNRGDGTFEDVTAKAGLLGAYGPGLGVVAADFNGNGLPDIFVANDGAPNQLWINQGDGTFVDRALFAGVALNRMGRSEAGMGVDAGDFDGDGYEDLILTHLTGETNTLYENDGAGMFEDRTDAVGLGAPSFPFTGFGGGWLDLNNNGWLDLLVVNGAVQIIESLALQGDPFPLGQRNQLFHNLGNGRFTDVSERAGKAFQKLEVSRGAAFGDLNNNGAMDVLVTANNGPARLLLNRVESANRWVGLTLIGRHGGRAPLGARVQVKLPSGRSLWRRVRTDGSYLSASDSRVLVGLGGEDAIEAVRVFWLGGATEEFTDVLIGRYNRLVEGRGNAMK